MLTSRAAEIARSTMNKHGLTDWAFGFDRSVRRFGCCHYQTKTITLSEKLVELNNEATVLDTILHEVAHAIVGHSEGHGTCWKAKARELGCTAERCYSSDTVTAVNRSFIGTCPSCERKIERHRRKNISCGRCCRAFNGGAWSEKYRLVWALNA